LKLSDQEMGGKTEEDLLAGIVYSLLSNNVADGLIPNREQILHILDGNPLSLEELTARLQGCPQLKTELSDILKNKFCLEVVSKDLSGREIEPTVAAFRELVPPLTDYIQGRNTNKVYYNRKLLRGEYSPADFPVFAEMDRRNPRSKATWILQPAGSYVGELYVEPIRNLEQLRPFRSLAETDFCFFNTNINIAQLYLYAAHQATQMLGIWEVGKEKGSAEPIGLVPLLRMWKHPKTEKERMLLPNPVPFLYAEALMIKSNFLETRVESSTGTTPIYDALLDIVSVYATLQHCFPAIGSCRKDDSAYNTAVRNFIEAAAARSKKHGIIPNRVGTQSVHGLSGKTCDTTDPWFECYAYMGLEEDNNLLTYLQERGYPFHTIMMFSQAFLNDDTIRKKVGVPGIPRATLYKEWGVMKGWTSYAEVPESRDIHQEVFSVMKKEVESYVG